MITYLVYNTNLTYGPLFKATRSFEAVDNAAFFLLVFLDNYVSSKLKVHASSENSMVLRAHGNVSVVEIHILICLMVDCKHSGLSRVTV